MTLDALCDYALSKYGIPYQWGGEGPDGIRNFGYDCSGLVQDILRKANVAPQGDFTANGLYCHFKIAGAKPSQEKGAIAFFGVPAKVSHVGFMLTDKIMISAASGGPGCKTPKDARLMHAMVKLQPTSWYKAPPLLASYLPNYGF